MAIQRIEELVACRCRRTKEPGELARYEKPADPDCGGCGGTGLYVANTSEIEVQEG